MPAPFPGYSLLPGQAFALGATGKTFLNAIASSDRPIILVEFSVSIDGTQQVLVELCESTQATAGTPGASGAASVLKQIRGFVAGDTTAPGWTHGGNYTAEPTVLSQLKQWTFQGPGPFVIQFPLGREVQSLVSGSTKFKALALRLTAASGTPNARGYMELE